MSEILRLAILGNCTTDYTERAIKTECARYGIYALMYNCPYNQYNQEIINKESEYYKFNAELTLLLLEGEYLFEDWYDLKALMETGDNKTIMVQEAFEGITGLIETIHSNSGTLIVLNNFTVPFHSPLGILDSKYNPGLKDMFCLLNLKLNEWSQSKDYVYIFDYQGITAQHGIRNIKDPKLYYLAKVPVSLQFTNVLAKEYMRYILPIKYKNKKCLVLDLDNTLWGGIIGEDGISGIRLDITGPGKNFYDFQKEILNLYKKGIILAINSKNNPEDAMEVIEKHPHMLLRKEHFACMKINWNDKVENLKEISKELNIDISSLVFFDDNPVERDFVRSMLPMICVVDVPKDTGKYSDTLKDVVEFEVLKITNEDIKRNTMYADNLKRQEFMQKFANKEDYLNSLGMKVLINYADDFSIPRIAQLTQKTNQFNMTTKRYSQADIAEMAGSGEYIVLYCHAIDRFSDNGIVGVCIVKIKAAYAIIDTFLLSCRVMGRNIEFAFLDKVIAALIERGVRNIEAKYIRTEKNKANSDFYPKAGFILIDSSDTNEALYSYDYQHELKKFDYIDINFEKRNL